MEGDRPWPAPAEHVAVGRRWKYAPPPWVLFEAVVNDSERWLSLLTLGLIPNPGKLPFLTLGRVPDPEPDPEPEPEMEAG